MQNKYYFIQLKKITLRHFSLYKKSGRTFEINEDIGDGVFCLAGANGLGKTTFLNSINYGLTGIVLEPNKEVFSPSEIVTNNKRYTDRYFVGRIEKKEDNKAEIEIIFTVNNTYFRIIRGFFERDELRLLEVYSKDGGKNIPYFISKQESPRELNDIYQKMLSLEIGFSSFDYFIFYQLYVLTFDENRRMIFWDDRASSHALAIAFNSDPNDADRILEMTRKMEKYESNGRNLRWQATQAKKKIEELSQKSKSYNDSDIIELEREYHDLINRHDKQEIVCNNIKIEFDSMLKKQSHLNSDLMKLRNEHTRLFSKYSRPRSILLENANVVLSLTKKQCCLCDSEGMHIVENIERSIHKDKCPLCNTSINESNSEELNKVFENILINDEAILRKNSELEALINELEGKKIQIEKSDIELTIIRNKINYLLEENPNFTLKGTGNKSLEALISQYKKQMELASRDSKEEYKKRDKLKPEYELILKKIEASYKAAETIFVPIFKKLAHSFIGLDLNIRPVRSDKSIKLVLELQDYARTESFQLSESQRFFLDIALRMSLAIFLSRGDRGATMLIDTPEGSLDIAYESRVGKMFADYVIEYGQNIFMTANINASQLLISLAERCGTENMSFVRMLDWTDPNPIQLEGEGLFIKVYDDIDRALNNYIRL